MRPAVFLSASAPSPERHPDYFLTADFSAIRESVVALVDVVLRQGPLVFGGHPAISPLVLLVAQRLRASDRVRIFQSEYFRQHIPPESLAFPRITWTPAVRGERDESLRAMRETMLNSEPFRAGVFIGGMEGVEAEYELFRELHPSLPVFPIASTGAAARRLLAERPDDVADEEQRWMLENELVYGALFDELLPAQVAALVGD